MIGILGGMGTHAGIDFCNKLAMLNQGKVDQKQPLFILFNKSNVPARTENLKNKLQKHRILGNVPAYVLCFRPKTQLDKKYSDQNTNFCEVAFNGCSATVEGYSDCIDSNYGLCEVSLEQLSNNSNECMSAINEIDCLGLNCMWGNSSNGCSDYAIDPSCYYEHDVDRNLICDAIEEECLTNEFSSCKLAIIALNIGRSD